MMIIFSGAILVLIFLRRLLGIVFRRGNQNEKGAIAVIIFYLNVILSLFGIVFKSLSWKDDNLLLILAVVFSVASIITWIFRKKFSAENLDLFRIKRHVMTFVLIYVNYVVIIIWHISIQILPHSYTLNAPFTLKKLKSENPNPQTDVCVKEFESNYNKFIENREKGKKIYIRL
jgi:hypothetical protein